MSRLIIPASRARAATLPVQREHGAVVAQEEADRADEAEPIGEAVRGRLVDQRERGAKALGGGIEVAREVRAQAGAGRERRKRVTGVSATSRRSALRAMATIASRSRAKAAPQLARLSR